MSPMRKRSSSTRAAKRISVHMGRCVRGLTPARIRQAVRAALSGRTVESLSVAVVDDATIAGLHERYMNQSGATDVLSFDLRDDARTEGIEGEIVVSADTARAVAARLGLSERQEVLRYVIHGALHLAGWDDASAGQRSRMRREENRVLSAIGEGATA